MAKDLFELKWVEELLPKDYLRKHMFGGFAYYVGVQIVMVAFENGGERIYNGKTYPYDIWNGCLFPAERNNHTEILKLFPFLVNHPVLPKWMYLPAQSEDFEALAESVLKQIRKGSNLFGVIPKPKKKKSKTKTQKKKKPNIRKPQMFG